MVMEAVKEQSKYQSAFRAVAAAAKNEASWVRRLRDGAFDRFEQIGFPTPADEEWKYTNVAPIARGSFKPVIAASATALTREQDLGEHFGAEASGSRMTFINGIFNPALSNLESIALGVIATDLAEALRSSEHEAAIRAHLARHADYNEEGFSALNTALFGSGAFLLIPKGQKVETPLHLLFLSEPGANPFAAFPRVLIIAEENSEATVIESYASVAGGVYFNDAVTEIAMGAGARLRHYKLQRESHEAFHIATTQVDLGAHSSFDTTTITLGAQLSRHSIGVRMDHEGAECWVDGLYMIDGNQHTDTHSLIDHRQPHCTSHQLYKGILDGKSRAVFNGKVFVRPGAQQTDAMQTNKNMLLSNEARVDTKPQLEIFADDVKCAHGAAIGQLDEDELFYLQSRGMNSRVARNLLTYGFAEEVIAKIGIESIKAQLDEAVLHRLHAEALVK
jgi:Fe-S cluster assembly protein SufD